MIKFDQPIKDLIYQIGRQGGKCYLVGGAVRDYVMFKEKASYKDLDIEIHRMYVKDLIDILDKMKFQYEKVGKSFGVFKLKGLNIDISFPRKEIKTSSGHKGFDIDINPHLGIDNALSRRDFTINAMALSIGSTGYDIIDPFNGQRDCENKILRVVNEYTFIEDPLRVLRGVQFASRFGLTIENRTFELMKGLI